MGFDKSMLEIAILFNQANSYLVFTSEGIYLLAHHSSDLTSFPSRSSARPFTLSPTTITRTPRPSKFLAVTHATRSKVDGMCRLLPEDRLDEDLLAKGGRER